MKKFILAALLAVAFILPMSGVFAATVSDVTASTSAALTTITGNIVDTVLSFLTTNLPIIVILGLSIGLVFMLIRWAKRATRGG